MPQPIVVNTEGAPSPAAPHDPPPVAAAHPQAAASLRGYSPSNILICRPTDRPKPWLAAIASPHNHPYTLPPSSSTSTAAGDRLAAADLAIRTTEMV